MVATFVPGCAAVVGLVCWLHLDKIDSAAKSGDIAQQVLTRAVVILFGVYLTVWSARNYRAQRHLNIVNDHRARALLTFGTFVHAAADRTTKNAVLVETTRSIFSAGSTGYVGGEDDSGAERLVALIKMATGGRGE